MRKRLARLRTRASITQSHRCYYCDCHMWAGSPDNFCAEYGLSQWQAQGFQCTAEHVVARRDGGKNTAANIVAACARCNRLRHARKRPMPPTRFKTYVSRRIQRGGWHVLNVLKAGLLVTPATQNA